MDKEQACCRLPILVVGSILLDFRHRRQYNIRFLNSRMLTFPSRSNQHHIRLNSCFLHLRVRKRSINYYFAFCSPRDGTCLLWFHPMIWMCSIAEHLHKMSFSTHIFHHWFAAETCRIDASIRMRTLQQLLAINYECNRNLKSYLLNPERTMFPILLVHPKS